MYLDLPEDPRSAGVVLKPLAALPANAALLNTGQELECRVDRGARMWHEPEYLRVRGLPVNELTDEVMVVRLEYDATGDE